MVANVLDGASCPGWYPSTMKRGAFVDIFWANVNNSSSFSMNAYKSLSLSNFAFTSSDITLLHKLRGLTDCSAGTCSSVIFVGDGDGGVDTRSTMVLGIFIVLAFFG